MDQRLELGVGILGLVALAVGCFLVLRPFISGLLWGGILAYTTWPLYEMLLYRVGKRKTLAASIMTAGLTLAFILPLILVGTSAADGITRIFDIAREQLAQGLPPPPSWLDQIPLLGPVIADTWREIAERSSALWELIQPYVATIRDFMIQIGVSIGSGVIEISLSVFAAFFFYRDGRKIMRQTQAVTGRVFGDRAQHLLEIAGATTRGVVYGIVGTALIQGALTGLGLLIVGIPSAFLLGFLSFIMALLPLGPAVIWGPIAIWLLSQGSTAWAIFLIVWGLVVVGSSDNLIRPWLISLGSSLTFLPVFLGVIGGAFAFGFLGIFIGPVLLAVGFAVIKGWVGTGEEYRTSPAALPPPDEPAARAD